MWQERLVFEIHPSRASLINSCPAYGVAAALDDMVTWIPCGRLDLCTTAIDYEIDTETDRAIPVPASTVLLRQAITVSWQTSSAQVIACPPAIKTSRFLRARLWTSREHGAFPKPPQSRLSPISLQYVAELSSSCTCRVAVCPGRSAGVTRRPKQPQPDERLPLVFIYRADWRRPQ